MHNTRFGDNRTGLSANPDLSREMLEGMERFPPSSVGDESDLAAEMADYVDADGGVGSVPMPEFEPEDVDEDSLAFFIDKLGERLAFERTGVRFYDGLLAKFDAYDGELPQGPEREELERIREQELEHFQALAESMLELGGDPTAVTPSADVVGVLGSGIGMVIGDPRTSLLASFEAILVAELADNECWTALAELARNLGYEDMAERFEGFLEEEQEHLMLVRTWVAACQGRETPTARH
jgi:rubrerythrin